MIAHDLLARNSITLEHKNIFDYGFGAGTFLQSCPQSAALFGVEIDDVNVGAVSGMLSKRGFRKVHLEPIQISSWKDSPLLKRSYDLIVCSHVLEHLTDPEDFLLTLRNCLSDQGVFVGIVPINELCENPHHVQKIDRGLVEQWAKDCKLRLLDYQTYDHLFYYLQPLYTHDSGAAHRLAQAISLLTGLTTLLLRNRTWWRINRFLGSVIGAKPAQAAFLLTKEP